MKKVKDLLQDLMMAAAIGLGIGLVLLIVFALLGALANGWMGALEASRGAVLVVGGLLMLCSGILMLKGGNLPPDAFSLKPGKREETDAEELTQPLKLFRCLPRQYVYLVMAAGILLTSLIPESIVLYYL